MTKYFQIYRTLLLAVLILPAQLLALSIGVPPPEEMIKEANFIAVGKFAVNKEGLYFIPSQILKGEGESGHAYEVSEPREGQFGGRPNFYKDEEQVFVGNLDPKTGLLGLRHGAFSLWPLATNTNYFKPKTVEECKTLIAQVLKSVEEARKTKSLALAKDAFDFSYPPKDYHLVATQDSPKHTFRVETYEKRIKPDSLRGVWLVAQDGNHAEWLFGPKGLDPSYSVEISVSPDEHWIMWKQKLYLGANAASLYERVSELGYKKIGPPIFSVQAWAFLSEQTHCNFRLDCDFLIRVSDWPTPGSLVRKIALYGGAPDAEFPTPNDHSLLLSLIGNDGTTSANLWCCYYDLEKHQFYLDDTLRKHNKGRVRALRD